MGSTIQAKTNPKDETDESRTVRGLACLADDALAAMHEAISTFGEMLTLDTARLAIMGALKRRKGLWAVPDHRAKYNMANVRKIRKPLKVGGRAATRGKGSPGNPRKQPPARPKPRAEDEYPPGPMSKAGQMYNKRVKRAGKRPKH